MLAYFLTAHPDRHLHLLAYRTTQKHTHRLIFFIPVNIRELLAGCFIFPDSHGCKIWLKGHQVGAWATWGACGVDQRQWSFPLTLWTVSCRKKLHIFPTVCVSNNCYRRAIDNIIKVIIIITLPQRKNLKWIKIKTKRLTKIRAYFYCSTCALRTERTKHLTDPSSSKKRRFSFVNYCFSSPLKPSLNNSFIDAFIASLGRCLRAACIHLNWSPVSCFFWVFLFFKLHTRRSPLRTCMEHCWF